MKRVHVRIAYVFLLLVQLQPRSLTAASLKVFGRRLAPLLATVPLAMPMGKVSDGSKKEPLINFLGQTRLTYAALNGDCDAVRWMLRVAPDEIDIKDLYGLTPLMTAIIKGDYPTIYALLESAPQLDIVDNRGNTALMLAIELKRTVVAEALIAAGANLAIRNSDGYTALGLAKRCGCLHLQMILAAASAPE